jgi:hypothetical protein
MSVSRNMGLKVAKSGVSVLECLFGVTILALLVVSAVLIVRQRRDSVAPSITVASEGADWTEPQARDRRQGDREWAGDDSNEASLREKSDMGQDSFVHDNNEESWAGEPSSSISARAHTPSSASIRDHFASALSVSGRPNWPRFSSLVRQLDAEQLPEAWSLLQEQPWSREKQDAMKAFVEHWATHDAQAALDFAMTLESASERRAIKGTAIKTWAATDPETALEWYEQQLQRGEHISSRSFFSGLYEGSPELTMERVWAMQDQRKQTYALRSIFLSSHDGSEQGAMRLQSLFDASEDPAQRELLAGMVAGVWSREDPMRAIAWADELGDEPDVQNRVYIAAAKVWGTRQPEAAMAWVQEQNLVEGNQHLIQNIARSWARDNPTSLKRWVDSSGASPQRDKIVGSFTREMARRDPAAAMAMAETVSDTGARYQLITTVMSQWVRRNKAEAVAAALSSSMPPEMKRKYAMMIIPK